MRRAAAIGDLFGHVPQAGELPTPTPSEAADTRPATIGGLLPVPPGGHTPDTVRVQALMILEDARSQQILRWSPREIRSFTSLFPYMCEWLKNGEGDRLLREFKAEMDRLNAPVDQVAPNWREMWGLEVPGIASLISPPSRTVGRSCPNSTSGGRVRWPPS